MRSGYGKLENLKNRYCLKCSGRMQYTAGDIWKCPECGSEELSDFGVVKQYLQENGAAPAVVISKNTGIPVSVINSFIEEGRLDIVGKPDDKVFHPKNK